MTLRRAYSASYNTSLLWHDYASWAVTFNGAKCTMQNFCFCFNALSCKVVIFVLKGETENESWSTTPPLTMFLFWNYNCCIQRHYIQMFSCNQNIGKSYSFFWRVRNAAKRDYQLRHICPSTRMELGFGWSQFGKSCISGPFTAVCRKNSNLVKWDSNISHFIWRLSLLTMIIAEFFLEWEKSSDLRCRENKNTHFMSNIFFPRKSYSLQDNYEKYNSRDRPYMM